eukprot:55559_1
MNHNNYVSILSESDTHQDTLIYQNAIYIQNMTMTNEHSKYYGGAMHLYGANVYIRDSVISDGTAYNGGCISMNYTALVLYQCVLTECTSNHNGAALFVTRNDDIDLCVSLYHTTFSNNYAASNGGAVYL